MIERDNGNVHRDAGEIIASKNRGAGGSVCNVLLSRRCGRALLVDSVTTIVPYLMGVKSEMKVVQFRLCKMLHNRLRTWLGSVGGH